MKLKYLAAGLLLAGAFTMTCTLTSCGSDDASSTAAEDDGADAGFKEVSIFEDEEYEFLNLSAVYFQPVDMTGGYKASDYDCHLELDISALANDLGYGTGDWVPYLTVSYKVSTDQAQATIVAEGNFMPMAASDGPHYGANIKIGDSGAYYVSFVVKFPGSDTYLIHTDETGPEKHEFPATITTSVYSWKYTKGAWEV